MQGQCCGDTVPLLAGLSTHQCCKRETRIFALPRTAAGGYFERWSVARLIWEKLWSRVCWSPVAVGLFPTTAKNPSWEGGETSCREAAVPFLP